MKLDSKQQLYAVAEKQYQQRYDIQNSLTKYFEDERHRYEFEKAQREKKLQDRLFYERMRDLANIEKHLEPKIPLTYDQKMEKKIFTLSEIIRLTDALSLSISSPEERITFDNIVRNWRDDKIKDIK